MVFEKLQLKITVNVNLNSNFWMRTEKSLVVCLIGFEIVLKMLRNREIMYKTFEVITESIVTSRLKRNRTFDYEIWNVIVLWTSVINPSNLAQNQAEQVKTKWHPNHESSSGGYITNLFPVDHLLSPVHKNRQKCTKINSGPCF